jgi:hypothetical protein
MEPKDTLKRARELMFSLEPLTGRLPESFAERFQPVHLQLLSVDRLPLGCRLDFCPEKFVAPTEGTQLAITPCYALSRGPK